MPPLQHLSAEARAVADLDNDRRLVHLAEDHWIDYPRARVALQVLERLLRCPERTRMPGSVAKLSSREPTLPRSRNLTSQKICTPWTIGRCWTISCRLPGLPW